MDRVGGLLPAEGVVVLLGADKTGKSILNGQLSLCIAAGLPFLGHPTRACPTLIVEEEGPPTLLQARLARTAASLGLADTDLPVYVYHRSLWRLDDDENMEAIEKVIYEHQIGAVIMASLAQLANVEDENKANGFNGVARNLLDAAGRQHTLFVIAHHRRKPDPRKRGALTVREFFDSSRGTNALTAAMDVGLGLNRDPESSTGELLVLARGNAPSRIPIHFDADRLLFEPDEGRPSSRQQGDIAALTSKLQENGSLTAAAAASILGVSLNTAKSRLEHLEHEGVVEVQPTTGSATVWVLTTS